MNDRYDSGFNSYHLFSFSFDLKKNYVHSYVYMSNNINRAVIPIIKYKRI